jgi:hypothetical protein
MPFKKHFKLKAATANILRAATYLRWLLFSIIRTIFNDYIMIMIILMMECDGNRLSDKYSSCHRPGICEQWNVTLCSIYRKLFVINGTHPRECELSAGALVYE